MTAVWVTEHDDPGVGYVVNELADMLDNFADWLEATVLDADEPVVFTTFEDYLVSWTRIDDMPDSFIMEHPTPTTIAWLDRRLA